MRIALAFLAAATATACATDTDTNIDGTTDGSGTGTGTGSGTGSGSGSGTVEPVSPTAAVDGSYAVRTDITVTVETILPETAANAVATLRSFRDNPARTLFDLAEAAGVPAVADIRSALPDSLESRLEGWLNEEIAKLKVNGIAVTSIANWGVGWAEAALTQFALDSTLAIDNGSATHTLTTIDFAPAGIYLSYPLGALPAEIVARTTTASVASSTLTVGDHTFGLAYGEYVWSAVDDAVGSTFGYSGIRETLGAGVNCPALANTVASKCYGGYCVGHAAELTEICEAGLDKAVEELQAKLVEMRMDAVHFASGSATIAANELVDGVWTAEINAGQGLRTVPATFTASK